jgi:beta-lactamase regulating signal transducer with metallopeptidase domain
MTTLLASTVDAAVVLALALIATAVLRRHSASLRHAILATAIVTACMMPAFELFLPQLAVIPWYAPVAAVSSGMTLTSGNVISGSPTEDAASAAGMGVPWPAVLIVVWMIGSIVTCAALMTGLVRLARLRIRCTPVIAGRWRELTDELSNQCGVRSRVTLLLSDDPSLLVTSGLWNPRIILPAGASEWTDDRKLIVLRHELAHIRRQDALMQVAGELLRIVQWVNPLVWLACRRLRLESEYACDDAVLRGDVEATEYATQLLDVARHLSGRHAAWPAAPAIAHPSTLERRIVAMLHRHRNRAPLSRRGWSLVTIVTLCVGIPLAAAGVAPAQQLAGRAFEGRDVTLTSPSRTPPAVERNRKAVVTLNQSTVAIVGTVLDQSGGTLPGAELTLTDQTGRQLTLQTDADGRFAFRDLQPARYELVARFPGFAAVSNVVTPAPDATVERTITLPLGILQETITLVCSATPAAARLEPFVTRMIGSIVPVVFAQESVRRIHAVPVVHTLKAVPLSEQKRVGGTIHPPRKLTDVKPVCPAAPLTDTTVRLTGRIGVDGLMNDVAPVRAEPGAEPPIEFIESALDAVRQWRFTATLLNGQPVDVNITVTVTFRRQ